MKEPGGGETLVSDPQVLATLARLPWASSRGPHGEGGRRQEGGDYEGEGYDGDGSTHLSPSFVGPTEWIGGGRIFPPTLGIPARSEKGSIGYRESPGRDMTPRSRPSALPRPSPAQYL